MYSVTRLQNKVTSREESIDCPLPFPPFDMGCEALYASAVTKLF